MEGVNWCLVLALQEMLGCCLACKEVTPQILGKARLDLPIWVTRAEADLAELGRRPCGCGERAGG